MSEPRKIPPGRMVYLDRDGWIHECEPVEAIENPEDANYPITIDAAELARLRKTNDRWEWARHNPKEWWDIIKAVSGDEMLRRVDAAIAAEKGGIRD